jgi:tryptase
MNVLQRAGLWFAGISVIAACAPVPHSMAHLDDARRILNGEKVQVRDTEASKSLVLVELLAKDGILAGRCSGTLIGRHTVLTAAHCFDVKTVSKFSRFNILFVNAYSVSPAREARYGLRFVQHPLYNSAGDKAYNNDIAVAFFEGPLPASAKPATIETDSTKDFGSANVMVYGYGFTKNARGSENENTDAFSGVLYRAEMKVDSDYLALPNIYFLVSTNASHVCTGDSGGPQFATRNGVTKQIGVNSTVMGGHRLPHHSQDCSGTSSATKVSYYAKWIAAQIQ